MRRILGIDPGSRITGVGIIESNGKDPISCVMNESLRLGTQEMPLRLGYLLSAIQEVVKTYRPTEMAIEQVFVHKNARSALILGQARGVAIAAAVSAFMSVHEYSARQIKQAVVGKGSADKTQIQHMIQILLRLPERPEADAADALAAAICHLHTCTGTQDLQTRKPSRRRYQRTAQWKSYDRTTSR